MWKRCKYSMSGISMFVWVRADDMSENKLILKQKPDN